MNPSAFHALSYGVYIITTWDNGKPAGCTANCAVQITSSPATIAVSINKNNYTHKCITESGHFAVNILSEQSKPLIIGTFGFRSGKDTDKFANIDYQVLNSMPIISDSCAYICCRVIQTMDTSTHTVFLGEVIEADKLSDATPMTYAYYHNVIKGKTAKNAPTYIAEPKKEEQPKAKYVCSVCGHVYDGDVPFEDLPDDWKCPICQQPKSVFKKQ